MNSLMNYGSDDDDDDSPEERTMVRSVSLLYITC